MLEQLSSWDAAIAQLSSGNILLLVIVFSLGVLIGRLWGRLKGLKAQAAEQFLHERIAQYQDEACLLQQRLEQQTQRVQQLEKRQVQLQTVLSEKQAHFQAMQEQLNSSREQMSNEFQQLASRIFDEKGQTFANQNQHALDALLTPFKAQIQAFEQRVNQIHDESLRGNVVLESQIKQLADMGGQMSAQANNLANALYGEKKTLGNWGEMQLELSLERAGLIKDEHYKAQAAYTAADGQRRYPDFIVFLPQGKHLVLDSKMSLVAYSQAVAADTSEARILALNAHVRAIRAHIDDLASKDYSRLAGIQSPSFVLMYLPLEAAYVAALQHDTSLYEYAWRKNIVLVCHSTLMPILKTVSNIWLLARSHEQVRTLSLQAGDIYSQIALVAERLKRLGATLGAASRHYNDTVTAIAGQQGLYGKVARLGELSAKTEALPELDDLQIDFQTARLSGAGTKNSSAAIIK